MNLEKWSEALTTMEFKEKNSVLSKSDLLKLGLIHFNLEQYDLSYTKFENVSWDDYTDCAWLRRMVIAPLIKAKQFNWASKLIALILQNHPNSSLDLMTQGSLLIRQNKRAEGCAYLEKILLLEKNNYNVAAQLIQLKLQDNKLEDAVKLAEAYEHAYPLNERLLKIALLTLSKAGKIEQCIKTILTLDFSKQPLDIDVLAAQIAFDSQDYPLTTKITDQLLVRGHEDARLYLILAQLKLAIDNNKLDAIAMLLKAHELTPDHIQVNNLLGDLLLKDGQYSKALTHLEKLKQRLPANPHTRLLYARALKFTQHYEQAADEMLEVVKLLPNATKWQRYAASALVQAGRHDEAKDIFNESVALREKTLSPAFEVGLSLLKQKIHSVELPQVRFDWLWKIIKAHRALNENEQAYYEEQVKLGYLIDHYLLDWLECRPHQADEPMGFLADLSEENTLLNNKLSLGKGLILASAHVGCLYAGPLALELLGLPYKWLASTPNIPSISYNDTLISTSAHTETEVVRQVIKSLKQGNVITIAVDGAMNPAAPSIFFEDQQVTYSDFAARMAFRTKAPSLFGVPFWENDSFHFLTQELPSPLPDEDIEEFCSRWTQCFLNLLRNFLVNNPSAARLSGGIWRSIK
ncbi:tetratricopeptide repeat protein [Legionella beliardensis]|nr:tetratricopeptide repeat protein [Legionella beliardensis]